MKRPPEVPKRSLSKLKSFITIYRASRFFYFSIDFGLIFPIFWPLERWKRLLEGHWWYWPSCKSHRKGKRPPEEQKRDLHAPTDTEIKSADFFISQHVFEPTLNLFLDRHYFTYFVTDANLLYAIFRPTLIIHVPWICYF